MLRISHPYQFKPRFQVDTHSFCAAWASEDEVAVSLSCLKHGYGFAFPWIPAALGSSSRGRYAASARLSGFFPVYSQVSCVGQSLQKSLLSEAFSERLCLGLNWLWDPSVSTAHPLTEAAQHMSRL